MRDLSKPVRRVTFKQVVQIVRSRDALQSVVDGPAIHTTAQMVRAGWSYPRDHIGDDDLWFAALRKLLPSYNGDALQIFRGQKEQETLGMSWTVGPIVAERFALYGTSHKATINGWSREPMA